MKVNAPPASARSKARLAVLEGPCTPRPRVWVESRRRILCVAPANTKSFGTFHHAFPLTGTRGMMPPQGLLLIASYLPEAWEVRFVDENVRAVHDRDFQWAEAVFLSGMHVQRPAIDRLNARARSFGKLTVLGGASVSACPEWYPHVDLLHVGELGDATDALIARLDRGVARPEVQEIYTTTNRLPLTEFPTPAYQHVRFADYFLGNIQASSGCPFRCEFCDIPELYGRNPRLKTPRQITAELDAMLARGNPGMVYFVDDNFVGNRKAAMELLPVLVAWQKKRGYPVQFACEATLNLAQWPAVLDLMREAYFTTIFCGIETPEEEALKFMHKEQNLRLPILDAVRTLNDYGLEVVSGIIVGLDTDTETTADRILHFIEASRIPLLTINILHALPKTPLWRRLEAAGRLVDPSGRESNVEFLLPYETVVAMWHRCVAEAFTPEAVYARFEHQIRHTYPNRKRIPARGRLDPGTIAKGLSILARVFWKVGLRADYRRRFWRMALPTLARGRVEDALHTALIAHHLIQFARDCAGDRQASFINVFSGEGPHSPALWPLE
jgi:radical SAM superfamily enzyme YgiQ (UPF0313 family)